MPMNIGMPPGAVGASGIPVNQIVEKMGQVLSGPAPGASASAQEKPLGCAHPGKNESRTGFTRYCSGTARSTSRQWLGYSRASKLRWSDSSAHRLKAMMPGALKLRPRQPTVGMQHHHQHNRCQPHRPAAIAVVGAMATAFAAPPAQPTSSWGQPATNGWGQDAGQAQNNQQAAAQTPAQPAASSGWGQPAPQTAGGWGAPQAAEIPAPPPVPRAEITDKVQGGGLLTGIDDKAIDRIFGEIGVQESVSHTLVNSGGEPVSNFFTTGSSSSATHGRTDAHAGSSSFCPGSRCRYVAASARAKRPPSAA